MHFRYKKHPSLKAIITWATKKSYKDNIPKFASKLNDFSKNLFTFFNDVPLIEIGVNKGFFPLPISWKYIEYLFSFLVAHIECLFHLQNINFQS